MKYTNKKNLFVQESLQFLNPEQISGERSNIRFLIDNGTKTTCAWRILYNYTLISTKNSDTKILSRFTIFVITKQCNNDILILAIYTINTSLYFLISYFKFVIVKAHCGRKALHQGKRLITVQNASPLAVRSPSFGAAPSKNLTKSQRCRCDIFLKGVHTT